MSEKKEKSANERYQELKGLAEKLERDIALLRSDLFKKQDEYIDVIQEIRSIELPSLHRLSAQVDELQTKLKAVAPTIPPVPTASDTK